MKIKTLHTLRKNKYKLPLNFTKHQPRVRRWYIARVIDEGDVGKYIDLYYSPASKTGEDKLHGLSREEVVNIEADDLSWWQDEDFEDGFHLSMGEFRNFLARTSDYPKDQPIEEGMVFLEIPTEVASSLIPFSLQARKISKLIYRRLVEKPGKNGEDAKAKP